MLEQEVLSDESRKLTPGDRSFCFNRTFFGEQCRCLQWELILFPAACLFFFFPPAILPVWFGWFSNTPVNPHTPRDFCDFREAGRYLVWSGAPRCTPCRCPSSPELSKHRQFLFFFFCQTVYFFPLNVTLEGAGARGSLTPVWICPFGLHLRVLRFDLFGGGDASLVLRL